MAADAPHDALFRAALKLPGHAAALLEVLLPTELRGLVSLPSIELHSGRHDEQGQHELLLRANIAGQPGFVGFMFERHGPPGGLALRVLAHQHRIWERHWQAHPGKPLPPVLLIVLDLDPEGSCAPREFVDVLSPVVREQSALRAVMPQFRCVVRGSRELAEHEGVARALSAFPFLVLEALRGAQTPGQILLRLDQWADALTDVASAAGGQEALEQLFVYILNVAEARALEPFRARVCRLAPEAGPALLTIADRLKAEGSRQGLAHGLAEGRRQSLEKLMSLKFGPLSDAVSAWIQAADAELLDRWLARVLTASSPNAVVEL